MIIDRSVFGHLEESVGDKVVVAFQNALSRSRPVQVERGILVGMHPYHHVTVRIGVEETGMGRIIFERSIPFLGIYYGIITIARYDGAPLYRYTDLPVPPLGAEHKRGVSREELVNAAREQLFGPGHRLDQDL